jgi:DNA modification methylase
VLVTGNGQLYQGSLLEPAEGQEPTAPTRQRTSKRANNLDGASWTRNSISIWSDIRKTQAEVDLHHPAIFPMALVTRVIQCFTNDDDRVVLDPFVGIGSTAVAAQSLGKIGIGLEINPEYADKAAARPVTSELLSADGTAPTPLGERIIHNADAFRLLEYVQPSSVDLVVTSPPYWDILLAERTADNKDIRHYGEAAEDLGKIREYKEFLAALSRVFGQVHEAMQPGKYCIIVVMDLRKKDKFYPFHSDIATFMQELGFIYDDIIIWDRRHEYNNMRPLGYPSKFRVNKAHEFILIFQKPTSSG